VSELYCETLKNCVGPFRTKGEECWHQCTRSAPPWQWASAYSCSHSSTAGAFQLELFDHPPYSRDLAPSDYHLFTYLKDWLGSQHLNNNEELIDGVKTWLSSQAADFYDIGIQKLIPWYHKCLISGGDYVEK
jgi:hypothetical protein